MSRTRGVSIYRANEAVDLMSTGFMEAPTVADAARPAMAEAVEVGSGAGAQVVVLARQGPEEGGFSLVYCWFKASYPLPRHSHDVDCMYYVLSGEAHMGSQVLRTGDAFFVPADAPYVYTAGPDGVEVLEIRHDAARFDMKIPDQPARLRELVEATKAHHDRWAADETSPTAAANRA